MPKRVSKFVSQSGAKMVYLRRDEEAEPEFYTPEMVLSGISTREDLAAMLDWYANPFIKQTTPDSVQARRYYIERTRPALRWYCHHFNESVPRWLIDDNLPEWSEEEREHLFGPEEMHVVEFERRGTPAPQDMQSPARPKAQ